MKVKSESEVAQSCPTLSGPMDCSLPGSSVHGISQARVLEWGAIAFSEYSPKYLERCDMAPFSEKCKNLTRERSTYERIRDKCELSLHTHLVLVHQLSHLSSGGSVVKNLPAMQETLVQSLGQEDPLEKGMATHSSILAWRIPWTEEHSGLQSMGLQRVRHD